LSAIISQYYVAGIVVAVIGGIITLYFQREDSKKLNEETADYRKRIVNEALSILEYIIADANYPKVTVSVWSDAKMDLLGNDGAKLWKTFYDGVEARRIRLLNGYPYWPEYGELNRACFDGFFNAYSHIAWVRKLVSQDRLDKILSKVKNQAILPRGWSPPA
jgi:hypothetical protein